MHQVLRLHGLIELDGYRHTRRRLEPVRMEGWNQCIYSDEPKPRQLKYGWHGTACTVAEWRMPDGKQYNNCGLSKMAQHGCEQLSALAPIHCRSSSVVAAAYYSLSVSTKTIVHPIGN